MDKRIEKSKKEKFQKLNKNKSEFIAFLIHRLEFQILVHCDLVDEKKYLMEQFKINLNFKEITPIFNKALANGTLYKNFVKKVLSEEEKLNVKFLTKITSLIKDQSSNIVKNLSGIAPAPNPDITIIFEEDVAKLIGAFEAINMLLDIQYNVLDEELKLPKEGFLILIEASLDNKKLDLEKFFSNLLSIAEKAENHNLLFQILD